MTRNELETALISGRIITIFEPLPNGLPEYILGDARSTKVIPQPLIGLIHRKFLFKETEMVLDPVSQRGVIFLSNFRYKDMEPSNGV